VKFRGHCKGIGTTDQKCYYRFSNGPRGTVKFQQQGRTVLVEVCARGKKPKHFRSLSFTNTLRDNTTKRKLGKAQRGSFSLKRSSQRCAPTQSWSAPDGVRSRVTVAITERLHPYTDSFGRRWSGLKLTGKLFYISTP
jgi:hypothetical protein